MKYITISLSMLLLGGAAFCQAPQADSASYATLIFYRSYLNPLVAPLKKVPIIINDSLYERLKSNTSFSVKLFRQGKTRLSTSKKEEDQFDSNIRFGKVYYYRCDILMGLWFGKPSILAVTEQTAKADLELLNAKTSKK
jgi:hypothetical protein